MLYAGSLSSVITAIMPLSDPHAPSKDAASWVDVAPEPPSTSDRGVGVRLIVFS